MRFECRYTYYPQPFEPDDYLEEMTIDIVCRCGDFESVVAGRVALDHLSIDRAITKGEDIYSICDADSAGWEHVFGELFEPGTQAEWRKDFQFDEPLCHLLFMHQAVFHPILQPLQPLIFDSLATLYGELSAFVMWKGDTDLTDKQLNELGFRIIAASELYFRPNMYQNEYGTIADMRRVAELEVPENAAEYVEANWDSEP